MVLEEVIAEVSANSLFRCFALFGVEAVRHELHVLFESIFTPTGDEEFLKASCDVVREPWVVENWDYAVGVGGELFVAGWVEADVAGVGVDEAGLVEGVATKGAAGEVGE